MLHDFSLQNWQCFIVIAIQLLHIPSLKFGKLSIGNLQFRNEEFLEYWSCERYEICNRSSHVSCKLLNKFTTERAIKLITSRSWTKYGYYYKIQRDIVNLYSTSGTHLNVYARTERRWNKFSYFARFLGEKSHEEIKRASSQSIVNYSDFWEALNNDTNIFFYDLLSKQQLETDRN